MDFEFLANPLVQWVGVKIHGLSHTKPCLVTRLWIPGRKAEQNPNPKENVFPFLPALFPTSDKTLYSLAVFQ